MKNVIHILKHAVPADRGQEGMAMHGKNKLILLMFLAGLLSIASCKKTWSCSINQYSIYAVKGGDTVLNDASINGVVNNGLDALNTSYYNALINYYNSNGYQIIKIDSMNITQYPITSNAEVKEFEDNGCKCIQQ